MAILMGLLSIVGGIALLMWRLSIAMRAARDIGDAAQTVANLPRKMRFQAKAGKQGLQLVTDPREAATVLMLCVARAAGEVTSGQKQVIREQIVRRFDLDEQTADDLLTHAAWLSKDAADPFAPLPRMIKLLRKTVTTKELLELEDMLHAVARADGEPNGLQKNLCDEVALKVGV